MSLSGERSVAVVDYGAGNLHSVSKALASLGADVEVSSDPARISGASHVVLPGVGAFGDGMRSLRERGLVDPLRARARAGLPLLGICLGMQLLFARSEEFGEHEGLGILDGDVCAIPEDLGLKVPHIGWNRIAPPAGATFAGSVLGSLHEGAFMYFVHSFSVHPTDPSVRLALATYGGFEIVAAVARGRVSGCQFHPEKSGTAGLTVLECFLLRG